ncbi:MAG: aldehyde dehydrogenase family protein, partial [Gemmatimonadetes bacterium]|nr:aldehyde dehydrogenase family protein [Gemmatimonadota bacterium]
VQEGIHDRLIAKLRVRMEKLRVGKPLDKAVDMGAIVAPEQLDRIRSLVKQGREEGAEMWQPSWSVPKNGCFYPPTLFTNVEPASTIAQVEIFGPVLVAMTFRTPEESVALANNTPFGLAASVWTENINLALDIAPKIKAGVVWVNATNLFDAAAGFGGYRESGFGREGGREGMYEYCRREMGDGRSEVTPRRGKKPVARDASTPHLPSPTSPLPSVDRTPKLFIGGKQARPDSGYSRVIAGPKGQRVGEVGEGNRKDIRNAVEAAQGAAKSWARSTAHLRAQILYYIGENLDARGAEFAARLRAMTGATAAAARGEVEASVARLFTYAAWADKWDGAVHHVPIRGVALAMNEPIGVVAVAAPDEAPLLGFVSTIAPLLATGNAVVALPSEPHPLAATDLYTVFESSDVPAGVVNIVTGAKDVLAKTLAEHDDVEGFWYWGTAAGAKAVEFASASNMKRTWCHASPVDWYHEVEREAREFLREASQVKNIWVPYGE